MAALVIYVENARAGWWREHMQTLLPELECRLGDAENAQEKKDDVEYAVVWKPPPGWLKTFPKLRCIVSIGAGVDHVLADPELPAVPLIRTTGDDLGQRMREYVLLTVLYFHRRFGEIVAARERREWLQLINPPAPRRRVGVMGLGRLGADCARALAAVGFDVVGWSRRPKTIDGVRCFAGDALDEFLDGTEILVCLLPLTPATERILNGALFARLADGAYVINVGRGRHLHETELVAALDAGKLAGAALDVFDVEPLPDGHPFWERDDILVTPHVGSLIDPEAGGRLIAANLRRFIAGEAVDDLTDPVQGY